MTEGPTPAARVRDVTAYRPPPLDPGVTLRLDANEGRPPSEDVMSTLARLEPETLRRYPRAGALEARLAARWGVDPARVVVTNGGDDAIDRACRAVLEPGRTLLTHVPTFEMIERSARLADAGAVGVGWIDGPFPASEMLSRIDDSTAMIALVTPNNPTGGVIPLGDVRRIATAAPRALVMVDLAYVEFADDDPTRALLDVPNVMIVRTFSKAFGLAGLRVGYAIAPSRVAGWIRAAGGPFPVAGPSLALAIAAIESDEGRVGEGEEQVRDEREELTALLREMGGRPLDSQANFVTCGVDDATGLVSRLRDLGIGVRIFSGRPELDGLVRITLPGDADEFERLAMAIRESMSREES